MGSVDTPRLYRKRCGIYFLRVIVTGASSPGDERRKRGEVRLSLRTKNPGRARAIAAWANARLELARTMSDREDILKTLGGDIRRMLTLEVGGIRAQVETAQDAENLVRILNAHPNLPELLAPRRRAEPPIPAHQQEMIDLINRMTEQKLAAQSAPASDRTTAKGLPPNPMRMSEATKLYAANSKLAERNVADRVRLLDKVVSHVVRSKPELGPDPFVHDIGTHHLSAFLDAAATKLSTEGDETGKDASPRTVIKKVSDLCAFFEWAREEREATFVDPSAALSKRGQDLKTAAGKVTRHYAPFTSEQISRVFAPKSHLSFNRNADYFWAPLVAVHLGTRLKEVVTLRLEDIGRHEATGIWFMDVTPEQAKNANSVRRLPVPQRLEELGFIDYVEHVRKLGASQLFPHVDFTSKTLRRDPSKNCSRNFGAYLDSLGLNDPDLVFHSFRHTVVTALQDAGVPLADAMQITGHQAQDHAVKTGRMTEAQAQSVFVKVYTHAEKARLNVEYPLMRLREHLDRAISIDIDYNGLRRAADIVRRHTIRTPDGFASGWSSLGALHEKLMAQLAHADS